MKLYQDSIGAMKLYQDLMAEIFAAHLVNVVLAVKNERPQRLGHIVLRRRNLVHDCLQDFLNANALRPTKLSQRLNPVVLLLQT